MATKRRKQYLYVAKLAQKAKRHRYAAKFIERIIHNHCCGDDGVLTAEEQDVLSLAYKNMVDPLRKGWRIVSSFQHQEEATRLYRSNLEAKLSDLCYGVLEILDNHLLPSAQTSDQMVFYMKMKGDYHRYLAEIKCGDGKKQAVKLAIMAYNAVLKYYQNN